MLALHRTQNSLACSPRPAPGLADVSTDRADQLVEVAAAVADQVKTKKTPGDAAHLADVLREFPPDERRFVADQLMVAGLDPGTVSEALRFVQTGTEPFYRNRLFIGVFAGVTGVVLGVGACLLARRQPKAAFSGLGLSTKEHLDQIERSLPEVDRLVREGNNAVHGERCEDAILKFGRVEHTMGYLRAHRQSTRRGAKRFADEIEQRDRDAGVLFARIAKQCVVRPVRSIPFKPHDQPRR